MIKVRRQAKLICSTRFEHYVEDITWARGDTNFIFQDIVN